MTDTTTPEKPRYKSNRPPKSEVTLDDAFPPTQTESLLMDILETQEKILYQLEQLNASKKAKK
jgi:hypothetical protein